MLVMARRRVTEGTPAEAAKAAKAAKAGKVVEGMVQRANAPQGVPPLPRGPYPRIVERVFGVDDPEVLYEQLAGALNGCGVDQAGLRAALTVVDQQGYDAFRLYVVAKAEFEQFEREMLPVEGAMRDAALRELSEEKASGDRTKQITEADVRCRMVGMFPDEYAAAVERRARAAGALEALKNFAEHWAQRSKSLGKLVG
jgi:hypothetical protein